MIKNILISLVTVFSVISLFALTDLKMADWQPVQPAALELQAKPNKPRCTNQVSCKNNPNCQCYCSVKCGPRDKKPTDKPIWVENDDLGHHCYCADRDWNLRNQCPVEKGVLDSKNDPMDIE
jgi:hypothetical protein